MEINDIDDLEKAIASLKEKKDLQAAEISKQFSEIKNGLTPKNILKQSYQFITGNNNYVDIGLKVATALGTGFVTKKIFKNKKTLQKSNSIITNIAKSTLSNFVANNIDTIIAYGAATVNNLFLDKKTRIV